MTSLILVIGVLNVCLGYALAVHLGYGPQGPQEPWEELSDALPPGDAAEGLIEDPAAVAGGDARQSS